MTIEPFRRKLHRIAVIGIALSAVSWCFTGTATAAHGPVSDGYYEFRVAHSGLCLDVLNRTVDRVESVVQASCSGGTNQAWKLEPTSDSEYYHIKVEHSDKCLDVAWASREHAAAVVQADCVNTDNQAWKFKGITAGRVQRGDGRRMPREDINYKLVAKHSQLCLDVKNSSVENGAFVVQARCWDPGYNQQWRMVPR
ncbi:RICIN domain-containing protein [Streptomyces achromogenes]|uniref:RICIN domain-containing protein n=1 Tax=Streptomyces achromogenes TaxID=67255 RepID=UPI0037010E79